MSNKFLISILSILLILGLYSNVGALPKGQHLFPWLALGDGNVKIPEPEINGIHKKNRHFTWGIGLTYTFDINSTWAVGPRIAILRSPKTDLTTHNYRWRYQSWLMPIEAAIIANLSSKVSVTGHAGLSYIQQKLSFEVVKPPSFGGDPIDITGTKRAWRPIVGLGISAKIYKQLTIGADYSHIFGHSPKAFNASTTSDTTVDSGEYRKIPSQDYFLFTVGYVFT